MSIKLHDVPRGSGKTTKIQGAMYVDESLFCLVPSKTQRDLYPKDLQDRVITAYQEMSKSERIINKHGIGRIVIDEAFAFNKLYLAELYYMLGYEQIDVVGFGTIE